MMSQIHFRVSPLRFLVFRRPGPISVAAGALLCTAVSTVALAQDTGHIQIVGGHGVEATPGTVQVAPQTVAVDPKTKIATVQFINTSADSAKVDVSVQYTLPGGADTAKATDSLAKLWSLAPWIQDAPKQVTLTPHETLTVKLHLTVPPKLARGDYSAYLIATQAVQVALTPQSMSGQSGMGGMTMQIGGQTVTMIVQDDGGRAKMGKGSRNSVSSSKIIYHAGN